MTMTPAPETLSPVSPAKPASLDQRHPGEPEYVLTAESAERHRAEFALMLATVSRRGKRLPLQLPLPELNQVLRLTQQAHAGRLHCALHGQALGRRALSAQRRVRMLWQNLEMALSGQADYGFAPEPVSPPLAAPWQVYLRPQGVALGRPLAFGFLAQAGVNNRVLRLAGPARRATAYCDVLAQAATVCRSPVTLTLRVQRVELSAAVRERLADPWLAEREGLALPGLAEELALWQQQPWGVRLTCMVTAAEPVPTVLLRALGEAVWGGRTVVVENARTTDPLDGREWLPLRGPLLALPLPDPVRLQACGLTVRHGCRPLHLATHGVQLGTLAAETATPVRLPEADRARHTYMIGATGTGKSTLLHHLIAQDLAAGRGLALIDPHGDLIRQALDSVPAERLDDVVLIEPGDPQRAVGLNFLACGEGPGAAGRRHFLVNELLTIFDRLYDLRATGGPIFEQYMRNALLLVMDNAEGPGTLMDIPLLFEDAHFRDRLLRGCRDPYVVSFWRKQAESAGGEASLGNLTPYITSKLNAFTHNPLLRPIVGQRHSTLDLRRCLDEGRIVLVSLNKGLLGERETQLLGMLFMSLLFNAALSRSELPPAERRAFHLYVDEAHHFTTDTVAGLLAEARKFGLHLTLANQTLAQMERHGLLDALLGNVGALLAFRLGVRDAERLASYTQPELAARDLEDLPNHHLVARVQVAGQPLRPFVCRTLPPLPAATTEAQAVRLAALRTRQLAYTRPIDEVEAELRERFKLAGRRRDQQEWIEDD